MSFKKSELIIWIFEIMTLFLSYKLFYMWTQKIRQSNVKFKFEKKYHYQLKSLRIRCIETFQNNNFY